MQLKAGISNLYDQIICNFHVNGPKTKKNHLWLHKKFLAD
jgi:hypothetical protein